MVLISVLPIRHLYLLNACGVCAISSSGEEDLGLGERVKDLVKEQSGWRPSHIQLLTHLSYFGYFFSPVSFYYCRDDDDTLHCIVAEVIFEAALCLFILFFNQK